ncbi:hypothetical protein [Streptomyces sp. MUM 178J]|uniref:hypothetical protein n=1 Tax=Streptomyces sp. MUM 178J TaxID=2791991 RepID=UPI001F046578|nr:hypothetical protein [Streptomyces sp. MUM 178J]WRQ82840.1 hypothetical protein I3F59_027775 [Streptomyces sp. MUM 178J]
MKAAVVWWDLKDTGHSAESLRDFLRDEAIDRFAGIDGLRLKFWISDPETERWGAVLLWESAEAAAAPLPARAVEIIGRPPVHATLFDVEAVVEGRHSDPDLSALGLARSAVVP